MGELGEYVGPMIGDEGGMLKKFGAKCPPGTASVLIAFAVHEWKSFASVLRSEYGHYKVSEKPRLDVLLKHADALVTWWLKRGRQRPLRRLYRPPSAVSAPTLPGQSQNLPSSKNPGNPSRLKTQPPTRPRIWSCSSFAVEVKGLEYAKNWSMEKYGCEFPRAFAIDCTETNQ